jgi:sodium-dependent phosphate cotransporter
LKFIIDPVMTLFIKPFTKFANPGIILCFVAIILLFVALTQIVVMTRTLLIGKIETFLDKYIFRNDLSAFLTGLVLTSTVQSSSVTTSLIVPLAGAGLLSLSQVFPYTLGTNIGSTVIVVFASLTTGNAVAITTAFCHTLFNCFGICIFYPLRILPITLAGQIGEFIGKAQRNVWIVIGCFFTLYLIPILFFTLK